MYKKLLKVSDHSVEEIQHESTTLNGIECRPFSTNHKNLQEFL